jgi:hypothetical protein
MQPGKKPLGAPGIVVEIPQGLRSKREELERKARFWRFAGWSQFCAAKLLPASASCQKAPKKVIVSAFRNFLLNFRNLSAIIKIIYRSCSEVMQ